MIASEDVRRVTFDKAMRGYRCEDVDDYLKQVADSMDALSADNQELQKKLVVLAQRIDQYRAEEDTLRTTMINAQRLGENVIKEAKQKAGEVIRAANIKAEDREQHARDEVELAQQGVTTLKREADAFKKNLMEMYRKHIELLSQIPSYDGETSSHGGEPAAAAPGEPLHEQVQQPSQPVEEFIPPQQNYFEGNPEVELPAQQMEEKVDTVEFAIAPKPDEPEDLRETPQEEPLQSVAGLFEEPAPAAPKKSSGRSTGKSRSTRKPKAQPVQEEELPAAFDSFSGVNFDN